MKKILQSPYPVLVLSWKMPLFYGLFVSLFLLFFKPFGLFKFDFESMVRISSGYGLVTFLIMCVNQFALPYFYSTIFLEKNWTVFREIIWVFWNVIIIAVFNYYYSIYIFDLEHYASLFFYFLMYTLLTSIIPVSVTILLLHNWKLKKNLRSAEEISRNLNTKMLEQKNDEKIVLYATNKKDFISTTVSDFLYIESIGNYNVIYWEEKGEVMHKKIRNTLKNMEDQLLGIHSIMRVHKAFIVNLDQIQEINGNAQGYQLTMRDEKIKIPVSRSYMKKFIAKMAI